MMIRTHRLAVVLVAALYFAAATPCLAFGDELKGAREPNPPRAELHSDFSVQDDFASHLPLLVLEISQTGTSPDDFSGVMTVYDNANGINKLADTPASVANITAQGQSLSASAGKFNHAIQLAPGGEAAVQSLGGLPAGRQWTLQGSIRDKGMLRNGLSYALGRVLFGDDTPEARFCEVLVKNGDVYEYHGLHILTEGTQPANRSLDSGGDSFVIQYSPGADRLGDDIVRLDNRLFTVISPADNGNRDELQHKIGVELAKLDNALQSIRPEGFLAYETMLDQRSVIDLFILNSLTLNALDTRVPFRISKGDDGRLQFLPVWSFDRALDNMSVRDYPLPFEEKVTLAEPPSLLSRRLPVWRTLEAGGDIRDLRVYPAYQTLGGEHFLWFDRLFLSRSFLLELYERYHTLRRTVLSPDAVQAMVDDMIDRLGPALERDWTRWNKEYSAVDGPYALSPFVDKKGIEHIRQTVSSDQDAVKIRRNLREQDAFLMEQMEQLAWMTVDLYDSGTAGNRQAAYSLATIVGMMVLMHLLSKKL